MNNLEQTIERTKMENALDALNEFRIDNDINDFYTISFRSGCIELQGYYTSEKVRKYSSLGFKNCIDSQGYVKMANNIFSITLTE